MKAFVSKSQSYTVGIVLVLVATIGSSLSGIFVRLVPELDGWQIVCWRGYWMSVSLMIYLVLCYGSGIGDAFRQIPRTAFLVVALFFTISSRPSR
jgi:EamA domain-containing membrane protein RarD